MLNNKIDIMMIRTEISQLTTSLLLTSFVACNAAATICPRPLKSMTYHSHSELSAWRSPRMSVMRVIVVHFLPSLKFIGLLVPKIWVILI